MAASIGEPLEMDALAPVAARSKGGRVCVQSHIVLWKHMMIFFVVLSGALVQFPRCGERCRCSDGRSQALRTAFQISGAVRPWTRRRPSAN